MVRLLFLLLLLVVLPNGVDQEEVRAKQGEIINGIAAEHEVIDPKTKQVFELASEPLVAWTSPTRGDVFGGIFLWTQNSRPIAYGGVYLWYMETGIEVSREYHSLTSTPILARFQGDVTWAPSKGVSFSKLPGDLEPAGTPFLRLRQMKSIVARMEVEISYPNVPPEEMRLLPTPIYRYSDPTAGVIDGAIFSFAKGTDPEALVLVEAFSMDSQQYWRFAVIRSTVWEVKAMLDGKIVYQVPGYDYQSPMDVLFYIPERYVLD